MQLAVKIAGPLYVLVAAGFGAMCSRIFRRQPAEPIIADAPPLPANVIPFERGLALQLRAASREAEPVDRAQ